MAKRENYQVTLLARTKHGALKPKLLGRDIFKDEDLAFVLGHARDFSTERGVTAVEVTQITSRGARKKGTRWWFFAEGREISDTTFLRKLNGPKK